MSYKTWKLTNNEAHGPWTHVAVFTYEDIADNATSSNQAALWTIPAGGSVNAVLVLEHTALAGATDITLDVGTTTGDPDEFIDALDVDGLSAPTANTGDLFVQAAGNTTIAGGFTPVKHVASATPIYAEWNGTVANLTAGKVIILASINDVSRFV